MVAGQRVGGQLGVAEVLEQLLEDVEHDRRVGRVGAGQELSAALVTALTGLEAGNEVCRPIQGCVDEGVQLGKSGGLVELGVAVALGGFAEGDVAEPELGHATAVHDERSDRVGVRSQRPGVDRRFAEPISDRQELVERMAEVGEGGRGGEIRSGSAAQPPPVTWSWPKASSHS
jgi:hypothetical protein